MTSPEWKTLSEAEKKRRLKMMDSLSPLYLSESSDISDARDIEDTARRQSSQNTREFGSHLRGLVGDLRRELANEGLSPKQIESELEAMGFKVNVQEKIEKAIGELKKGFDRMTPTSDLVRNTGPGRNKSYLVDTELIPRPGAKVRVSSSPRKERTRSLE